MSPTSTFGRSGLMPMFLSTDARHREQDMNLGYVMKKASVIFNDRFSKSNCVTGIFSLATFEQCILLIKMTHFAF